MKTLGAALQMPVMLPPLKSKLLMIRLWQSQTFGAPVLLSEPQSCMFRRGASRLLV